MVLTDDDTQVIVGAGVTYFGLIKFLAEHHLALEVIPSDPHINVVGSLVTGSHAGGIELPPLAAYVNAYRYLSPNGKIKVSVREEDPHFFARLQSFGTGGAITAISLRVFPEFAVKNCVYRNLQWGDFLEDETLLEKILTSGTNITMYTDWSRAQSMTSVWVGSRLSQWSQEDLNKPFTEVCNERFFGAWLV